eukprot:XP_015574371.1 LOW QUALITY PROTEIN: transcription factor bHLH95-like [Ricinus communis]
MSKEEHESFFWENPSWVLSNSDNLQLRGSEQKNKMAAGGSRSTNSQTEVGKEISLPNNNNKRRKNGNKGSDSSDAKEEKAGGAGGGGGGGGESDHEIHIWTERERRKKMRNMFANLHALLPQLPPKADKSTIVDEAVNYIKTLQQTLQKLQKQKLERLQGGAATFCYEPSLVTPQKIADSREAFMADQGSSNNNLSNVTTRSSNNVPSIPRYPVLFQTWTSSNVVLNICGDEAQISICSSKKPGLFTTICYVLEKHNIEMLSAHVSSDSNRNTYMIQAHVNGASNQFAESITVEEIYRQAAGEIMCWVSS